MGPGKLRSRSLKICELCHVDIQVNPSPMINKTINTALKLLAVEFKWDPRWETRVGEDYDPGVPA